LGMPRFHASLPPEQALAERFLPEEGEGPLQRLPWDALPEGDFCTDGRQPDRATPFGRVWDAFAHDLAQTPGLTHARGCILIHALQPHLKQVQLYITYEGEGVPAALLREAYRFDAEMEESPQSGIDAGEGGG